MLLANIQVAHGARHSRGEPFAISPDAMSGTVLNWGARRIRKARQTLIDLGLLCQTHQGGAAHSTTLVSSDWASRGFRLNYNVTEHPPLLLLAAWSVAFNSVGQGQTQVLRGSCKVSTMFANL
jgi:hypothetical protein